MAKEEDVYSELCELIEELRSKAKDLYAISDTSQERKELYLKKARELEGYAIELENNYKERFVDLHFLED